MRIPFGVRILIIIKTEKPPLTCCAGAPPRGGALLSGDFTHIDHYDESENLGRLAQWQSWRHRRQNGYGHRFSTNYYIDT